ncbi:MAG: SprT protein [Alphaproteobacteria bacterium]|jgi:SprT protein
MNLSTTLQKEAQTRLNLLFDSAIKKSAVNEFAGLFRQPSLAYNQRGRIAASALLQKNIIKINPTLYSQNTEYFISHIIAHELAHIMVYQLYGLGVKPHGIEWQKVMLAVFDLAPKVTHTLDVSAVTMRQITYECACQQVPLSLTRHNKVLNKKQSYICRKCNTTLTQVA